MYFAGVCSMQIMLPMLKSCGVVLFPIGILRALGTVPNFMLRKITYTKYWLLEYIIEENVITLILHGRKKISTSTFKTLIQYFYFSCVMR